MSLTPLWFSPLNDVLKRLSSTDRLCVFQVLVSVRSQIEQYTTSRPDFTELIREATRYLLLKDQILQERGLSEFTRIHKITCIHTYIISLQGSNICNTVNTKFYSKRQINPISKCLC